MYTWARVYFSLIIIESKGTLVSPNTYAAFRSQSAGEEEIAQCARCLPLGREVLSSDPPALVRSRAGVELL